MDGPVARSMRRLAALAMAGGLLFALVPTVAAANLADFGTPSVKSVFGTGITFQQPVTINQRVKRAELLLTVADAMGPTIVALPDPPAVGATALTHVLKTGGSDHMMPNTPITARWRLIPSDPSAEPQLGPETRIVYRDDRFDWKTQAGDLVRVHWYEGTAAFGKKALKIAEDAIRNTSKLLGVTETEPVDFYIYATQNAFLDAIGPRFTESVGGLAESSIRTLFTHIAADGIDDAWIGHVIPHELTHLVFNTAVQNPYHFPPKWLNEGLAEYQSIGFDSSDRSAVRDAVKAGTLIPLDGLVGQFPAAAEQFYLAYSESTSAVDFLVRTYGTGALVKLIRSYAAGRTDDEAFKAALGVDTTGFGDAWLADVGAKAPTQYGPQPAPAGPVPSSWTGGPIGGVTVTPPPGPSGGAPAPTIAASPPAGGGSSDTAGASAFPVWVPPLFAVIGIVVVVVLLVAARRNRASGLDG